MFLFVFMVFFKTVEAQEIRINEAVSSNSVFVDENGETPDWFELHNYGSTAISLNNWSITDDSADLKKWVFPNIIIEPDEYLMIWASGNDYRELKYARTLIDRGDECKYIIPSSELPTDWSSNGFNDTSWDTGNTGLGYGDNDDQTIVPAGTRSVFVRSHFFVSNPADLAELILDIDYDDGFVAYINGVEIARANINGTPPAFNSGTFQDHEALIYGGGKPDRFIVNEPANIIVTGENVLSIQLHNVSENSSDMTLIPFLSGIYASPSNDGVTPPPILNLGNTHLHTNFKISSAGETLTLSDEVGNIVDVLTVEGLVSDMSIGVSSTSGNITYYTSPTPGEVNDSQEYLGAITKEVLFSHQGGIVDGAIALTLSGNTANEIIRYTTDKTEPNETSPIYSGAINISSIAVIRARMFKDNYIPSYTYSKAYIFNTTTALPVVSLVTDPYNLFDNDYGIYELGDSYDENMPHWGANFWEDWERPIQFSLYETDGSLGTEFNGGVKIFGGWSRANAQRSLSIFARGSYGVSEIDYKFFEELNYDKFQAVVLRNSGNDWLKTNIRDAALTSLMEGADIEFQAHRSTATYINGEYWGIYNLREKVNEHFLASKHNIDADDIDLLERNGEVIEGSNLEYNSLIEYITTTDLTSDVNFEYIENNVDVDNFILYEVAQIYFNNTDWPGNNIKFWKHPEGKWRWILYDTDFGFGIWNQYDYNHDALSFAMEPNGPGWPNPPWSTLMLRRLMTNISFRNRFINRFADELNSRFLFDNVSTHIQDVSDVISSEIPAHYNRWSGAVNSWSENINNLKVYAANRPYHVKQHIRNKFQLATIQKIIIENDDIDGGFVQLNNHLKIESTRWLGDYFEGVPITLKAIPEYGFKFSHWSGAVSSTESEIEIDLNSTTTVKAHFVESTNTPKRVIITEINYNSGDIVKPGDWVELYNPNSFMLDISGWALKDDDDTHIFNIPTGTTIAPEGFIVLARNSLDFSAAFPDVTNFVGDFGFGLSSTGDAVRIYDLNSDLQDEVYYRSSSPWPECANGTGATLELLLVSLDNSLPESWTCANNAGSPGKPGISLTSYEDLSNPALSIYPNPLDDYLYIEGLTPKSIMGIYDLNGRVLMQGEASGVINVSSLKAGSYILKIKSNYSESSFMLIKQ